MGEPSDGRVFVIGSAWAIFAITIWAGWMVFTRLGVTSAMSPYDIVALRFGTAGILLLPVAWKRGLVPDRVGVGGGLIMAAGCGALYALVVSAGLQFAPAAHGGTIVPGFMPLFVALLSIVFLSERIPRRRWYGFALIVSGILVIGGTGLLAEKATEWLGHVLFLVGAILWASYTVVMRRSGLSPLHATSIVTTYSIVLYLPIYLLFLRPDSYEVPVRDILFQAFYQGVLTSIVSLVAYNRAVVLLGASRGSAFASLVPVLSMLIAIPLLGEIPSGADCFGIVLVSAGVYLATGARVGRW